jgi:RimJ/RimL family protein N-acetyltransferase
MHWSIPHHFECELASFRSLTRNDAQAISAIATREAFTYLSRWPTTWDTPGVVAFVDFMLQIPHSKIYLVSDHNDTVAGMTGFLDISEQHRHIEIGWTWYHPRYWGTGLNRTVKYMMMSFAFEQLNCLRITFTADARNKRSIRAIERIGAIYEGCTRKATVTQSGFVRDTALFGMLDTEWDITKEKVFQGGFPYTFRR